MIGASYALQVIAQAFSPAWWALAYQVPIAFLLAYVILRRQAYGRVEDKQVLTAAAISGAGGGFICALFAMPAFILLTLIGALVMWFIASFTIDRYLDVDVESSNRVTAAVCVPTWLVWLVIGAVIIVLQAR